MVFNLIPKRFCFYLKRIAQISALFSAFGVLFVLATCIVVCRGSWPDWKTILSLAVAFVGCPAIPLFPIAFYSNTIWSTVTFSSEQIIVRNYKGRVWRKISYNSITSVRTEEIADFFYGQHRETWVENYICIFLNDNESVPDIPYHKLFGHPDFFMMQYDEKAVAIIENSTGAGSVR